MNVVETVRILALKFALVLILNQVYLRMVTVHVVLEKVKTLIETALLISLLSTGYNHDILLLSHHTPIARLKAQY